MLLFIGIPIVFFTQGGTAQLASCELRTIQSSMDVGGVDLLGGVTFQAQQQVDGGFLAFGSAVV
jgi:hypothetical protein